MAQLNTFIANNVPLMMRHGRDFTGPRGWCHIGNLLFKRLEQQGLFDLGVRKERAVEVDDKFWIDIPSDCRRVRGIYYPPLNDYTEKTVRYRHEIVNGKIKLWVPFNKDEDPDTFTLSEGTTTTVKINDSDATEDQWADYALVLTDGTYSGDTILVKENTAADAGTSTLTFVHTQSGTIDSTAGYLTQTYLMLKYTSRYTPMTAEDDEIPLSDDYEGLLAAWYLWKALPPNDKSRRTYRDEFLEEEQLLIVEACTPTEDQARPYARSMPGLEDCEAYDDSDSDYIGDDD